MVVAVDDVGFKIHVATLASIILYDVLLYNLDSISNTLTKYNVTLVVLNSF